MSAARGDLYLLRVNVTVCKVTPVILHGVVPPEGAHVGWARERCRSRVLTRRRVPQVGWTPLYIAAQNGHLEVARFLAEAGADKHAPTKVKKGGGGRGAAHECLFGFLLGVAARLLTVSVLTRVVELCNHIRWTGIA